MSFLSDYLARRREILEAQTAKHEEDQASPEALLEALNTNTGNTADLIGKQSKESETQNRAVVGGLETISKVLESSKPAAAKVEVSIERASELEQSSTVVTNKALASIAESLKTLVETNKQVEKHLRPDLNSTDDTYQKRKDVAAAATGKTTKEVKPKGPPSAGLGGLLVDAAYDFFTKKPATPTSGKPPPTGNAPVGGRTTTRGGVTRTVGSITPKTPIPTEPVQGRVGKFLSNTRQVLGNVGTKVSETATRLAPKMQEFATRAWDATKGAATKVGEFAETNAPKVKSFADKTWEATKTFGSKVGENASKAWEATKSVGGKVGEAVSAIPGASTAGKVLGTVGRFAGKVLAPAIGTYDMAKGAMEEDSTERYARRFGTDTSDIKDTAGGLAKFTALRVGGAATDLAQSFDPSSLWNEKGNSWTDRLLKDRKEDYAKSKLPPVVGAAVPNAPENKLPDAAKAVIAGSLGAAAAPGIVSSLTPSTAVATKATNVVGSAPSVVSTQTPEAVKAALGASIAMAISPIAKDSQDALNTKLVPALNETGKSVTEGAEKINKSNETLAASFIRVFGEWKDKFSDMLGGVKSAAGKAYDGAKSAVGGAVSATGGAIGGGAQAAGSAIERMTAGTRFAGVGKTVGAGLSKAGESVAMQSGEAGYNLQKGSASALELAKGFQGTTTLKGLSEAQTKAYAGDVMKTESGGKLGITNQYGYLGQYQFGADALSDQGLVDKDKMTAAKAAAKASGQPWYAPDHKGAHEAFLKDKSNWKIEGGQDAFLQNKQLQDDTFGKYTNANIEAGYKKDKSGKSALTETSTPAEIAGYAKAAHLVGAGAANDLYKNGIEKTDANKTKASDYAKQGATAVTELAAQLGTTNISQTPTTLASAEQTGGLAPGAITKSTTSIKPTFAKAEATPVVEPVAKAKSTGENLKLASSAIDDIPNTTAGWFDKKRNMSNPTATIGIRGLPMDQVAAMNPDIDPMTGELKAKPTSKAQKMKEKADRIARWEKEHPEDIGMFPGEGRGKPESSAAEIKAQKMQEKADRIARWENEHPEDIGMFPGEGQGKPVMPLGERVISQPGVRVSEASAPPTVAQSTNRYSGQSTYGGTPPAKAPTGFSLDNIGNLINSPAASALLSLPEMRPAMQSADLAKAAARGDVGSILSNPAISGMVKNPEALRLAGPILQTLNQSSGGQGNTTPSFGGMTTPVYGASARSSTGTTGIYGGTQAEGPRFNPVSDTEFVPFDVPKGGYKTVASRSADISQVGPRSTGMMSITGDGDCTSTPSINSVRQEPMSRVASNVPAESQSVVVENAPQPQRGAQSSPPPPSPSNAFDTAVPKIDNIPLQISDLGLVLLNIGHI